MILYRIVGKRLLSNYRQVGKKLAIINSVCRYLNLLLIKPPTSRKIHNMLKNGHVAAQLGVDSLQLYDYTHPKRYLLDEIKEMYDSGVPSTQFKK